MKTLKNFLTEAPNVKPMDWKDAFEICILYSIPVVNKRVNDDFEKLKNAWIEEVKSIADDAKDDWDKMPADEKENAGDFETWFDEYFEDYSGEANIEMAWGSHGKGDLGFFTQYLLDTNDVFHGVQPPPSDGDWNRGYYKSFDDVWVMIKESLSSWGSFYHDGSLQGPAKQMGVDATKKMKTDWKMLNSEKMAEEVCSIMVEGSLKITPQSQISKLMLKPNFGVTGIDKVEWVKFIKKPFTYDRPWMIGLEKQYKKWVG